MQIKSLESPEEITKIFDIFLELYPYLTHTIQSFVKQVIDQQKEGYKIVSILEGDEIVACIGFRIMTKLSWGKVLFIDDFITKEKYQGQGYGKMLLAHVVKIAKEKDCGQIHLDTGYTRHASHRFYLNHGFQLQSHHLVLKLK